jgi:effector-binding domain-containing protein
MPNGPVTVQIATPRGIAAVRARVRTGRVGLVFKEFLDEVYAAAQSGAIQLDGQNVFVYRPVAGTPETIDVEFGVGAKVPFAGVGSVIHSQLPVGEVATTTHWGDYAGLGDAHNAVSAWCKDNGRTPTGVRWEVYGHWDANPAKLRTDVFYQLAPLSS